MAIHRSVTLNDEPNYCGARIPLPTHLNIGLWRRLLNDYEDKVVVDFLQYGWPINYSSDTEPSMPPRNYYSAHAYATHVDKFICEEIAHGATLGPFETNPFESQIH